MKLLYLHDSLAFCIGEYIWKKSLKMRHPVLDKINNVGQKVKLEQLLMVAVLQLNVYVFLYSMGLHAFQC